MSKVVGIDLGATNSVVAVLEGGTPQVIPNQEGARTTPSIVAFTSKGERLVGQVAKRQALTNPQNTVFGVKRLMGRKFRSPEVQRLSGWLPYSVVEGADGEARIRIDDRVFRPEEILATVLRKLKSAAEDYLGEPVAEAILTAPVLFDARRKQALKDAATIAGLKVNRLLNESTAAALTFGMTEKKSGIVVIYDLGGGGFNVSVLELQDGIYQVLASGGDVSLGGEDFDQLIVEWLVEDFRRQKDIDLREDRMALQRLKEVAEKAKCELSTQPQAEIWLPFLSADRSGPWHLRAVLPRSDFERMIQPLLDRTVKPCEDALKEAGIRREEIAEVIPIGGQTRTPRVLETMKRIFGNEPNRSINPDEVVSIGAAIQTGILQGEVTDLVLLDVIPSSLGIETRDGTFTALVERNANIPTKQSRVFTLGAEGATSLEIHVLEGEGSLAHENTSLGRILLDGLPGPRKLEITFEIDVNGMLDVGVRDVSSSRSKTVTIRAKGGLTQAQVEKARADLDDYCERWGSHF